MKQKVIRVILGPTNTGKTYAAIERMLGHESGMIGFPLRLLARENYDRIVEKVGKSAVALITGEEKIVPPNARYYCCTVEAMPVEKSVAFLAVDEIQLAGDRERGHVFTDRLFYARGKSETMFMGAETIRPFIRRLLPDAMIETRPRLSRLSYAGVKKVTRLQRRSAIVAFSASDVYALAETVRRQRGGCGIVMGALSPRTRNKQVEMYQNGEVDFLIATDAIGMGLNMDIHHVALASDMKFDGRYMRRLMPQEMAQIAGRAGRHMRDGTFGMTDGVDALEPEEIAAIENHHFPPLRGLYWRARDYDFSSPKALIASLEAPPPEPFLQRQAEATDHASLIAMANQASVKGLANSPGRVRLLWDVASVPDFRNMMTDHHTTMLVRIYENLATKGVLDKDWVAGQLAHLDRLDGDIDTIMMRIAHIRTWTYITHRSGWTDDPEQWQDLARRIEDRLSDELHNQLTQKFVDKRAAHLSRKLKEQVSLSASVKLDGTVLVEGEEVGRLDGFTFTPDISDSEEKAMILAAARKGLPEEIERRVRAVLASADEAFKLQPDGVILWRESPLAKLLKSDNPFQPRIVMADAELVTADQMSRMQERVETFMRDHVAFILGPLLQLANPPAHLPQTTAQPAEQNAASQEEGEISAARPEPVPLSGVAKGLAYQLYEAFGTLPTAKIGAQLKDLSETDRPHLARLGIRLGVEALYMAEMLKPATIKLRAVLWSVFHQNFPPSGPPPEGRVSINAIDGVEDDYWYVSGYRRIGTKIMRVDMVERVSALVRAAARQGPFKMTDDMLSLAGVSREEMKAMILDLGCQIISEEPSEDPEKPAVPVFERVRRQRGPRKDKNATGANQAGKEKRKSGKAKGPRPPKAAHKTKEADPNSPFAVLAALKK
ncbi:MAG: helicase-related protein [Candidatus Puniceispirillaceae bacterium]